MTVRSKTERLTEIDSLRGFAALWVVVFHLSFGVRYFWLRSDPVAAARVTPFSTNIQGLLGVDLFFLISGFVIFMTLERSASIKDFAFSRFSRLFPAYWACLFATTAASLLAPEPVQTIGFAQFVANFTMLNTFVGYRPIETVYWSLSYELAFYGMMASIFAAGAMERIEWIGGAWLALSAFLFTIFPSLGATIPWRLQAASILPYTPLFFAGILVYRGRTSGWTASRAGLLLACFVVRLCSVEKGLALSGTAAILAIFTAATLGWAPFLRWRPLVFLGGISYPLYLIHHSIGYRIQSAMVLQMGTSAIAGFLISLSAVALLAWGISVVIERPLQNWLRTAYRSTPSGHDIHA